MKTPVRETYIIFICRNGHADRKKTQQFQTILCFFCCVSLFLSVHFAESELFTKALLPDDYDPQDLQIRAVIVIDR